MTMKKSKTLQHIAAVAAVLLTLCLVFMMPGAAEPDLSGDVVKVTAANAQDVLDGKYGAINGKTIHFTENIDAVLDLARPTKYQGSGTVYYKYNISIPGPEVDPTPWSSDISSIMNSHSHYYRTLNGVTFTADEGVTVAGFTFSAGHVASSGHDYVRDVEQTSGVTYYKYSSLEDITFKDLTFTGRFDAKLYLEGSLVSNVNFDGCTFTGTSEDTSEAAIKFLADNQYFTGITVKDCNVENYNQGVYISGIDGATITGNTISETGHNSIALQSCDADNPAKGTVTVENNYLSGAKNRAIRLNYVSDDAKISINNNIMVNSGDSDGQLIAAVSVADGAVINLDNNYWDSEGLSKAIGNGFTAPTAVGIISGTWSSDVTPYVAEGYASVLTDGKYVVEKANPVISVGNVGFDSVKVGYTQPDAKAVTVENKGNVPVTLTAPVTSDKYIIGTLPTIKAGESATFTIQPVEGLAVGNYEETIKVTTAEGAETSFKVSFLVYQPSSGGSSTTKPEEPVEPEQPVEPETPTEEPVAGEPSVETEVTDGGEVLFEAPVEPETPGADTPSDEPAEPAITGVVLPEGTDSEVAFIPVSEKPAPAGKEENTKKVFEINVPKYEKGKPATVKFTMTVAELAADGKTAADVALWHQDEETGEWTKLVTTFVIIDGVVYFEAITFDFSPFAIVYEDTPAEEPTEEPTEEPATPAPILAVLAGLGAAVVLRRK